MEINRSFQDLTRFAKRIVSLGEKNGFNERWNQDYIKHPIPSMYSHIQVEIVKVYQKLSLGEITPLEAIQQLSLIEERFDKEKKEISDFNLKILLWNEVVLQAYEESEKSKYVEFNCPFCNETAEMISIVKNENEAVLVSSCVNCDIHVRTRN